jgi:hypothetical protein
MAVVWTISSTQRETTNNGITVAHWAALDSEDVGTDPVVTHYGSCYGSCNYTPDHTAEGFTAYASLTEADVIAWVKESLGEAMVTDTENAVAAQIADSKAPAEARGVPW